MKSQIMMSMKLNFSVFSALLCLTIATNSFSQEKSELHEFQDFNDFNYYFKDDLDSIDWVQVNSLSEYQELQNIDKIEGLRIKLSYRDQINLSEFKNLNKFENLRFLHLKGPKSTDFPEEIGTLENLEVLILDNAHNVNRLPENLFLLKNLVKLKIYAGNKIEVFPTGIENLTKLEELELTAFINLHTLPDELGSLKSLKKLKLGVYADLPESIGGLDNLEYLSLNNSGYKKPKSLFELKKLSYLYFEVENETDLSGISNLKNLEKLELFSKYLTKELTEIPNLKFFKNNNNWNLDSLPEIFSQFKHLEGLSISSCPKLSGGLEKINELTSLKFLSLHNLNSLTEIPPLKNLKQIEYLQFSANKNLDQYPENVNGVSPRFNHYHYRIETERY